MKTTTPTLSESGGQEVAGARVPERVCVVCRKPHPRTQLIRLLRRPTGRIGWPDQPDHDPPEAPDAPGDEGASAEGAPSAHKRRGTRNRPTGKGLYVCSGGDCLARLLSEKRFKRMFVESMEEGCVARLSASLRSQELPFSENPLSSRGPKAKIEGRDVIE